MAAMAKTRPESFFVVVASGLVPDFVVDRVGPVRDPGESLGQRERRSFGVGEVGRVTPRRHGEDPLVGLARLAQFLGVPLQAAAAAVDLTGADVHEVVRGVTPVSPVDSANEIRAFKVAGFASAGFEIRASMMVSSKVSGLLSPH